MTTTSMMERGTETGDKSLCGTCITLVDPSQRRLPTHLDQELYVCHTQVRVVAVKTPPPFILARNVAGVTPESFWEAYSRRQSRAS